MYGTNNGTTGISTFSADVIQSNKFIVGIATVSPLSGGISTIKSSNESFPGTLVKENDLIQYSDTTPGLDGDPIIARVTNVGTSDISVEGVAAVTGISSGFLPSSTLSITDLKILTTQLATSSDNSLFTPLPKVNVSNVDLAEASLVIRKTFIVNIDSIHQAKV